ncbi:MAG: PIG-L family deacetylase [Paracoccaceae bacterium]
MTDRDRLAKQQAQPRAVMLWKALQPLKSCISFMNTGAHPDDETTSMLAVLGLRDGIKLSHACSTRGEGGQNSLGVETIRDLGAIRTREMERAAEVLDITQYWHSASVDDTIFDFGFSKSGDETLEKWGEERTMERFVLILRRERPDIICPTFLDIPGQHGHHRAMTRSAFRAVELAADPLAFPEQGLSPWQVKKIYLPAWSGSGDSYDDDLPPPPATVVIDGTGSDPVLGADYAQIAQWSRAFHATQGMGTWVKTGAANVKPLHLAWAVTGNMGEEDSIKENLPADLSELAEYADAPGLKAALGAAQVALDRALSAWPVTAKVRNHAREALALIGQAEAECPEDAKAEVRHRLAAKRRQLAQVLMLVGDIRVRLIASETVVRAGDIFSLELDIYTPDQRVTPRLNVPDGWSATDWVDGVCSVTVGAEAATSDPYPDTWFPDRANGYVHVVLEWDEDGQAVEIVVEPEERLNVLPSHSAELTPAGGIVNLRNPKPMNVGVSRVFPVGAAVEFAAKNGWEISSDAVGFSFEADADLAAGLYEFPLVISGQDAEIIHEISYEHTGDIFRFEPAIVRIRAMDAALPEGRIGYIGGGSDQTDIWLREVGMDVVTLDDAALERTDFSEFQSVLVGIFSFRTRPILASKINVLHEWVRSGGNLVTLYHRPWDNWDVDHTALAHLRIGKPSLRWRVTDENAVVTHLEPEHKLLNYPNKITESDWEGWKKERGLYFAAEWDETAYKPLLSMADPDEDALLGSMLTGEFGKGRHTHTSLILHHQVAELVPGAYRLLANLLTPR